MDSHIPGVSFAHLPCADGFGQEKDAEESGENHDRHHCHILPADAGETAF